MLSLDTENTLGPAADRKLVLVYQSDLLLRVRLLLVSELMERLVNVCLDGAVIHYVSSCNGLHFPVQIAKRPSNGLRCFGKVVMGYTFDALLLSLGCLCGRKDSALD